MSENLIKSNIRVKQHGEVFTPKQIVNKMLNQPEIQENIKSLTSTFLEPAAGEGAFLIEILRRKLKVALKNSQKLKDFGENSLLALSSLYGIELLEDNIEMLVMNMFSEFNNAYLSAVMQFEGTVNKHVLESAKTIIRANMVQGDTLKRINNQGQPIVFSEWKLLPLKRGVRKVQRTEFTLDSIIEGGEAVETSVPQHVEEFDLFADSFENESAKTKLVKYVPVRITEVYKQLVKEI